MSGDIRRVYRLPLAVPHGDITGGPGGAPWEQPPAASLAGPAGAGRSGPQAAGDSRAVGWVPVDERTSSGDTRAVAGPPVVLASGSERRRELLARVVGHFEVVPAEVDESPSPGEPPAELAARLARAKADAVGAVVPGALVVGSDTAVELDGIAIGKPRDAAEAAATLRRLAGRTHRVHTAVALVDPGGGSRVRVATAAVTFGPLTDEEVDRYVAGGEPMGKAGSYAIQGAGAALVERIEGDPTTVVGLPLRTTMGMLADAGFSGWAGPDQHGPTDRRRGADGDGTRDLDT